MIIDNYVPQHKFIDWELPWLNNPIALVVLINLSVKLGRHVLYLYINISYFAISDPVNNYHGNHGIK